jgi:hypothetical protein
MHAYVRARDQESAKGDLVLSPFGGYLAGEAAPAALPAPATVEQ